MFTLRLLPQHDIEIMCADRLEPASDIGPGDDRRTRIVLSSHAIHLRAIAGVESAVILVFIQVVDVHTQRAFGIEATTEIKLHVWAEVNNLHLGAVDITQLGIRHGNGVQIVVHKVIPSLVAHLVGRLHHRDGYHEWAAHCAVGALIEAILDGIAERGVGAHGESAELAVHIQAAAITCKVGGNHEAFGV